MMARSQAGALLDAWLNPGAETLDAARASVSELEAEVERLEAERVDRFAELTREHDDEILRLREELAERDGAIAELAALVANLELVMRP